MDGLKFIAVYDNFERLLCNIEGENNQCEILQRKLCNKEPLLLKLFTDGVSRISYQFVLIGQVRPHHRYISMDRMHTISLRRVIGVFHLSNQLSDWSKC